MASTYKTPGVYVEEISVFPPSIAQVETAVPAFIGYTEKAALNGADLHMKPTRVRSLAEFEQAFGAGPRTEVDMIELDNANNVTETVLKSGFLMYDSLRLFFANGGSKCYIISIGDYPDSTGDADDAAFSAGLDALSKEDEPTLILFPDAVLVGNDKLYSLQQKALAQCAHLQDRFLIMDLYRTGGGNTLDNRVEEFRDKIGIRNLMYGAAYAPYLETNLEKKVSYRHIQGHIKRSGSSVDLKGLATDPDTVASITRLENAISDVDAFKDLIGNGVKAVEADYMEKENSFKTKINDPSGNLDDERTAYKELLQFVFEQLKNIPDAIVANPGGLFSSHTPSGAEKKQHYLIDDTRDSITSGPLYRAARELNALAQHAGRVGPAGQATAIKDAADVTTFTAAWGSFDDAGNADDYYPIEPTGNAAAQKEARISNLKAGAQKAALIMKTVLAGLSELKESASGHEKTYEAALVATFPLLKTILRRTKNAVTEMPPSGAIAGVYAHVDSTRGVFKSPANVSLSEVIGVSTLISKDEQEGLNVDVVAGKSINAIRPFTGKGILVWGARTLAGNDNEWRYISVRRFFNMVEESASKATERFVFEPNDANTWTKVKTMIENFLINQWRGGALAGATPDQAFFVKVGLGQTMTAQDVLEGYMIVEIGMAVVRPAEFIILRFSHKMQEA
ncbi:MAG: phage tail sheath C-terminal domain-containing protein [Opitutales bacterium]